MGGHRPQSASSEAHDVARKPWTPPCPPCPNRAQSGSQALDGWPVADVGTHESYAAVRDVGEQSVTYARGKSAGYLDGTLRAGRTPGSWEEGGGRDGPTLQRTRSTLWTLRQIHAHYLLHPLGDGQRLPRRGRRYWP